MTRTMLARIIKLERVLQPAPDESEERGEVANWAASNPDEASRLISEVSARLLGPGNESHAFHVPPEPAAVHAFFMRGL